MYKFKYQYMYNTQTGETGKENKLVHIPNEHIQNSKKTCLNIL